MESYNLPPDAPTLIESTRAIGYSLQTAIADIIDNSIAAKAKNIRLFFFPSEEYIAILDDGSGMSEEELRQSMRYGSTNPNEKRSQNDLGRFGLGLKTASLSQCKCLTVISKQKEDFYGCRWDIDHIVKSREWSLLLLSTEEISKIPCVEDLKKQKNGTLVIWQNLDKIKAGETDFQKSFGIKINDVREHLSLVFHRFISGEEGLKRVNIYINNAKVEPKDPFLKTKSHKPMDAEAITIRGSKVIVQPYILPHPSKLKQTDIENLGGEDGFRLYQGFYIYRNKRLLIWGDWFKIVKKDDLSKLARIQVDIPNSLDDLWTLDIKKSSAIPPAEVRNCLYRIIEKCAELSKRTYKYRGKKETDKKVLHVWNRVKTRTGKYIYEINQEHPYLVEIFKRSPESKNLILFLFKQIENNLPLNSIHLDLQSETVDMSEKKEDLQELLNILKILLNKIDKSQWGNMIESLVKSEPFIQYAEEILNMFKDGKL